MFIYSSTKVLPYVYMCKEKGTDNFYIGYRYANKVPSTADFGTKYFTSNDYIKENFDKFDHYIIAEFFDKKDAYKFESQLIHETNNENQINSLRIGKLKGLNYKEIVVDVTATKICPLPECNKPHTNWRMKCCCMTHQKRYAGIRSRQT